MSDSGTISVSRRSFISLLGSAGGAVLLGCHAAESSLAHIEVYKNASCECCKRWVEHVRNAGFSVTVYETYDLQPIKQRFGVPLELGSCHTARMGKYFIEGHVPAAEIARVLREQPKARGITVPAMPLGSPGMESPTGKTMAYDVFLVDDAGERHVYARHGAS